ncbi:ABC transporter permease [Paucibacter sp. JuS9]|uniref:ABC transporter permease n=1 Tax=Roseateles TaxID=93681 RepID=UPI002FE60403
MSRLWVYVAKRCLALITIVLGVMALVFVLSRLLPSSPVELALGSKPTAEQIATARAELGLDRPLVEQFARFAANAVQGDLGRSLRTGLPVAQEVRQRFAATAELVSLALLLAVLVGVPLGVWSAARQGRAFDQSSRTVAVSLLAVPVFFLGILLQLLFYGHLQWLPLQGRIDSDLMLDQPFAAVSGLYLIDTLLAGDGAAFRSALEHLVLPVTALAAASLAVILRTTRNVMAEILQTDHVRTARAYGMHPQRLLFGHALRAAMLPLLTVIGLSYGFMLGGSVIVEYVFDWPGIGGYIVESVVTNDQPAVIGVTLLVSTVYLLINLLIDLLYFAMDPRLSP